MFHFLPIERQKNTALAKSSNHDKEKYCKCLIIQSRNIDSTVRSISYLQVLVLHSPMSYTTVYNSQIPTKIQELITILIIILDNQTTLISSRVYKFKKHFIIAQINNYFISIFKLSNILFLEIPNLS